MNGINNANKTQAKKLLIKLIRLPTMNIIKQTLENCATRIYSVYYAHRYLGCRLNASIKAGFHDFISNY